MRSLVTLAALSLCGLLFAEGVPKVPEESADAGFALREVPVLPEEDVRAYEPAVRPPVGAEEAAVRSLRPYAPVAVLAPENVAARLYYEARTDEAASDLVEYASGIPLTPLWSIRRRIEAARAKGDEGEESLMRSLLGRGVEVFLGGGE